VYLATEKDDTGDYILKEEVEKAITRMKNNKSPGISEITSETRRCSESAYVRQVNFFTAFI